MPEFKKVPDAPGWWIRYYLCEDGLGDPQKPELVVIGRLGPTYPRFPSDHIQDSKRLVWYGPLPTDLPEGWGK